MAIYHLSMQIISRSKGQSAVAAASYRSGEKLTDERTGEDKYYPRAVAPETMILAPSVAPEWVQDRNRLWNEVEQAEKRKDSQLAREINIALPRELSQEKQRELIQDFVQDTFVQKGMIADIAIHRDDVENPHAHIMLTMRTIQEDGFGKKNRDWNADFANAKENQRGFVKSSEACLDIREQWANYANKALERANIQEKITHLSHEARGLEQMPTVHLGHVAHDMEKRGIPTEKGNVNRDRQEYNALVVDLQKYREEKQALEQEKARQKAEKQTKEDFYTAAERVDLQYASKLLKKEPSMANIVERRQQLDKWEARVDNGDQFLRWKDRSIQEAFDHFRLVNAFNKQVEESQDRLANLNWLNPLKLKHNQKIKEEIEEEISHAKGQLHFHEEKLHYYQEKLGFTNEEVFNQVKIQHETERPELLKKNQKTREQIKSEREALQKAENAYQKALIRKVASKYPERPEMRYISVETAKEIAKVNKLYAKGKTVPIEQIEKTVLSRKEEIQRLEGEISRVEETKGRLQRANHYLEQYEKHQAIVEKYENNPFLKGKLLVSKSAKEEYENALSERDNYEASMKKERVSGRTDLEKQVHQLEKMTARIPEYQQQIQTQPKGLGLLEAVVQGMEQAGREMLREQKRQQQQARGKKKKQKQNFLER